MSLAAGNAARLRNRDAERKFLGVYFRCCRVYGRIWLNRDASAYEGRCPRCFARLRVRAGASGTSRRFFEAI